MAGYDTITTRAPDDPVDEPARAREVIATLQQSLLPVSVPSVPGVAIEGRYRLGRDGARCGGDWYDAIALPDGRLLLVVGDVVGHGVAAASTMGRMRIALQIYAAEGFTPQQMLGRLNRHAFEAMAGEVATVLVLVLDPGSGRATIASAGHPPPVLRDAGGPTTLVDLHGGPPIGATLRAQFSDHEFVLPAGGALVLYTDGIVERRGEDLGAGMARLTGALAHGPETAAALADHIIDSCDATSMTDDVALLVVAFDAEIAPLHLELPARPRVLRAVRNALGQWMTRAGVGEVEASDILLAVNEAVANAIEHAYGPGDGDISIDIEHDAGVVRVRVRDEGQWRPARAVGGGLGMGLMHRLVDDVAIESTAAGTTVEFRARVAS